MSNKFAATAPEVPWLVAAKMMVSKAFPYLNVALYSCKISYKDICDPAGNPTMGIDPYWRLYINPLCEKRWHPHQAAVILVHEIWHVLREHGFRCEEHGYDPKIWNMAADCEINRGGLPYNLQWPEDILTYKKLGLPEEGLAEEYYDLLTTRKRQECPVHGKNKQNDPGQDQQGQGQQGEGDCTCKNGNEVGDESPGMGGCGSGAHGQQRPHEDDPPEGESKGTAEEKTKRIAYEVARGIKEETKIKNNERGDVPAGFARWADAVMAGPQVDWRKVLRSKVTRAIAFRSGFGRPTYTRRSRRQYAVPNIILPGQRKPVIRVGMVMDTSGSMTEDELGAILNETSFILGYGDTQGLYVMAVDAAVHWEGEVTTIEQVQLAGGGGTDMGVGIEHAQEVRPKINVLIVATDTETPWPKEPPANMSVIVLSTSERGSAPQWVDYFYVDPTKLTKKH